MASRYAFHIALDGNGLNGLEGRAGVCVFRYDPITEQYDYDIKFYDGVAGGHAVSVSPDRKTGFLGTTGQHLMFYDPENLQEVDRISTLQFEPTTSSIHGTTHCTWLGPRQAVVPIGGGLWQIDLDNLSAAQRIGNHQVKIPHSIKVTPSGRYLVYGSMDHPEYGEAKTVGIFDLQERTTRIVELPTTCWHLACHPTEDRFYALSFRVHPQNGGDYHEWGMADFKEYAFEIDAAQAKVVRHFSTGRDTPAHINSDVCLSDRELIYCNGASGTIMMIDLATFSSYRILDARPRFTGGLRGGRAAMQTMIDSFARGSVFINGHHFLRALMVSRGSLIDSVYACQLSADGTLLFTANRGVNTITVYNYPENTVRLEVKMPELQKFDNSLKWWNDPRLGFHHSALVSPKVVAQGEGSGDDAVAAPESAAA